MLICKKNVEQANRRLFFCVSDCLYFLFYFFLWLFFKCFASIIDVFQEKGKCIKLHKIFVVWSKGCKIYGKVQRLFTAWKWKSYFLDAEHRSIMTFLKHTLINFWEFRINASSEYGDIFFICVPQICFLVGDRSTFMANQNGLCLHPQLFIKSRMDKKRFIAKYPS